ncbi:2OG-Fe(II) oxygenase [Auriculariales sp. MPI-PUGE-AT-0066]|nr:2OG-Fe(II) oxygenase [Auriculariales sp. MPI-PUGE-AT-0066]
MNMHTLNDVISPTIRDITSSVSSAAVPNADHVVATRMREFDMPRLKQQFTDQDAFLYLDDFLLPEVTAQLVNSATDLLPEVNRNYLPGHKQGGSVSRHTIDAKAPFIAELYRSKALIAWLEQITGDQLQVSPTDDPHAYALYYYTKPGDHIGWHYDTSFYNGRRYTVLLAVTDNSSCKLEYELYTRRKDRANEPGSIRIQPGGLVAFDGDKLRHRVTPAGSNEMRVSLTFEYLTDPNMRPWRRVISNFKDAIAYFGFRQVFRQFAWQGSTLFVASWGLAIAALFHLVPLVFGDVIYELLSHRALVL